MSEEEFTVFLAERARLRPQKTAEEFLTGLFHKKMIALWVKCSRISKEKPVGTYSCLLYTSILKKQDATIFSSVHDLNIAAMYCDRILLMDRGRIIKAGTRCV